MENQSRRPYGVRRTPEQIKAILEKFEASGKTMRQFVAEEGLALSTLESWRRRERTQLAPKSPAFVEVQSEGSWPLVSAMARVRFGDGLVIELSPGFAVDQVGQLIERLRQ